MRVGSLTLAIVDALRGTAYGVEPLDERDKPQASVAGLIALRSPLRGRNMTLLGVFA